MKKYIEVDLGYDPNILEVEEVVARFRKEEKELGAFGFSLMSYEDTCKITAEWQRPETPEEKEERLKNLTELEKKQLEYERQKFEELKKKFEPV